MKIHRTHTHTQILAHSLMNECPGRHQEWKSEWKRNESDCINQYKMDYLIANSYYLNQKCLVEIFFPDW